MDSPKKSRAKTILATVIGFLLGLVICWGYFLWADKNCPPEEAAQPTTIKMISYTPFLLPPSYSNQGPERREASKRSRQEDGHVSNDTRQLTAKEPEKGERDAGEHASEKHNAWAIKFACEAKATDIAMAYFTWCLVIATLALSWTTLGLWEAGEEQIAVARKAADAALGALDRPWLVIEGLRHTKQQWIEGKAALTGSFRIHNYGKAPAFVIRSSIKAAVFMAPRIGTETGFPFTSLETIKRFPNKSELAEFIRREGVRPTLIQMGGDTIEDMQKILDTVWYSIDIVVPPGESTRDLHFMGNAQLAVCEGIRPEFSAQTYMIGKFIYSMPGHRAEVISFCYEGSIADAFQALYGEPYNDRRQIEDEPAQGSGDHSRDP